MAEQPNPLGEIWTRSITDPDFRARLLDDPRTTFRDEMALEIREGTSINVVENTDTEYTIVLPDAAGVAQDEEAEVAGFGFTASPGADSAGRLRAGDFAMPSPGDFGFGSNPFRC